MTLQILDCNALLILQLLDIYFALACRRPHISTTVSNKDDILNIFL